MIILPSKQLDLRNCTLNAWQLFAQDLPNVIVSELEVDVTGQQIVAATFGRGLWGVSLKDEISVKNDPKSPQFMTMTVAPNPSNGHFSVEFFGNSGGEMVVELVDILGRKVKREVLTPFEGGHRLTWTTDVAPGSYFVAATGNGSRLVRRIVVE